MRRVALAELQPGDLFIMQTSWGERLYAVSSFFRADRVWYRDPDTGRNIDWCYTTVEVEVDR